MSRCARVKSAHYVALRDLVDQVGIPLLRAMLLELERERAEFARTANPSLQQKLGGSHADSD